MSQSVDAKIRICPQQAKNKIILKKFQNKCIKIVQRNKGTKVIKQEQKRMGGKDVSESRHNF